MMMGLVAEVKMVFWQTLVALERKLRHGPLCDWQGGWAKPKW